VKAYRLLSHDVIDHPVHGPVEVQSVRMDENAGVMLVRARDEGEVVHDLRITLGSDVPLLNP
jgi:hypothetical protein